MTFYDMHTHSVFSPDSDEGNDAMVRSAIEKGCAKIAVTDHFDPFYPKVSYGLNDESFDFSAYRNEVMRVKDKYKDKIEVLYGIEVSVQQEYKEQIDEIMSGRDFDIVIASQHSAMGHDLYEGQIFEGKTKQQVYLGYFEDVLRSVKAFDFFNVIGHLDFVCRYGRYDDNSLLYEDYSEIIDEVLRAIIAKGKGIEVNTSGYRYGTENPHPRFSIIKRYRELGGEIITTGSDAHFAKDVAFRFTDTISLLKEAGFKRIAVFKEQKPEFIEI